MYLSKLILNPASRMVQSELRVPYQMHRTLMKAFPDNVRREDANLLYRIEPDMQAGGLVLLAQSTLQPDWTPLLRAGQGRYLLAEPQSQPVNLHLPAGLKLQFRLAANPIVKKTRRDEHGRRRNSNRVPLVREEHQIAWLQRKGEQHGFRLLHVLVGQPQKRTFGKSKSGTVAEKRPITLFTVRFDGVLQITDAEAFEQALRRGIGPAKAFGCGLLSLAPFRSFAD